MNMPQQSWSEQGHALAPLPLTLVCGINKASFLSAAPESRDANPTELPMSLVPGSENCGYNFVILQLPRSDRCQRMTRPPTTTAKYRFMGKVCLGDSVLGIGTRDAGRGEIPLQCLAELRCHAASYGGHF